MNVPLASLVESRWAFADPASGKKTEAIRRTRARSAIVVVTVDALMRFFVLHTFAARCSTDELTDHILMVNDQFRPRLFGIEANAMQSLYGDMVGREARQQSKVLPLTAIEQPTGIDKDWRIRSILQPVIRSGRMILQPHQHELRQEIGSFPMSSTKDLVDALASVVAMVPVRQTKRETNSEVEALARYLREAGVPASQIVRRIEEELARAS